MVARGGSRGRGGRVPAGILAALAVSTAGLAVVMLGVPAPWRGLVTLPAALWAPGHVLVAAVTARAPRRLTALEHAAAAVVLALAMLPVLALATFLLVGVTAIAVAVALTLTTSALAAVAVVRAPAPGPGRASLVAPLTPPPRAAFAVAAAACALAIVFVALPLGAEGAPAHVALTGADGAPASLPRAVDANATLTARVEAGAGDAPRDARLVVRVVDAQNGSVHEVANEPLRVDPGLVHARNVTLGPFAPGAYKLEVAWADRTAHAWIHVGAPDP